MIIVFTQYDRLVRAKIEGLRAKNNKLMAFEAQQQGETEAARALDDCVKYLEGSMKRLKISMPQFANVSGAYFSALPCVITTWANLFSSS